MKSLLKSGCAAALMGAASFGTASAAVGPTPRGIPHLDHVFVIMMENHGYAQIIGNPYAPFINNEASYANLATNYFAVAHPSLTNYLEIVGGSNFGVLDDNAPDFNNAGCTPNLRSGVVNTEQNSALICPIAGTGTEAATPAVDYTNENPGNPVINVNGTVSYPALTDIYGMTIADQLVAVGLSWKSYQQNLPLIGAANVVSSDGVFTSTTNFTPAEQALGETDSAVVGLYAAKHDPFVYFANVQNSSHAKNGYNNIQDFDGPAGLYADLAAGTVPSFSLIAPNQCNDMHGRGNAGPFCAYDPANNGTQTGLNPGLIAYGDDAVNRIVTAIKASPVWKHGHDAIVIVWDENDYSIAPVTNQVVTIVDTNYGSKHVQSQTLYTHFSLLRSIEGGLGVACLNHACDTSTAVMSDLFK